MLTKEEKINRQKAVQFAINNNRLKGLDVSDEMLNAFEKWINDEISMKALQAIAYEI
ncbi:antitoxin VbhA family protein [Gallibacterium anatis]|uniref:antitoxin VbhA family protein n=1 Tax=Gallibacterium anatis TaxID=750 RepID=UPI0030C9AF73